MAGGHSRPGVSHAPEYLVSGIPWLTGSLVVSNSATTSITFPNVSKFFVVKNNGTNPCRVGFTTAGIEDNNKHFAVSGSATQQFDLRVKTIYLRAEVGATNVDVLGGLTAIPGRNYLKLTGSSTPPTGSWYIQGIE